jgi:hypothetical protein
MSARLRFILRAGGSQRRVVRPIYPREAPRRIHPAIRWGTSLGAGDGNRTRTTSLEGWGSTIELHPRRASLASAPSSAVHHAYRRSGLDRAHLREPSTRRVPAVGSAGSRRVRRSQLRPARSIAGRSRNAGGAARPSPRGPRTAMRRQASARRGRSARCSRSRIEDPNAAERADTSMSRSRGSTGLSSHRTDRRGTMSLHWGRRRGARRPMPDPRRRAPHLGRESGRDRQPARSTRRS